MECAVCGSPDSSCIRLQPDMLTLLQDHLKFETDEPSKLEVCSSCCSQLLAWSVYNDQYQLNMSPFCVPEGSQEYDVKQEALSSSSNSGSGGEDSEECESSDSCNLDPSIFFPEVKLEVQEGEVLKEASQPVPQSSLQSALLKHSTKTHGLPLYLTNTKANKPGRSCQSEQDNINNINMVIRRKGGRGFDLSKHYCNKCDKIFKKASNLKRHLSIHIENRPLFYCSFCRAHFSSRDQVRGHILQKHLDKRRFKCDHCSLSFKRFQHLKRHKEIKHNPNKTLYPCEFCGKNFNSIPNKGFHIIRVHAKQLAGGVDRSQDEDKDQGGLSCDVCGKQVKTVDILKRHQLLHLDNKPTFECKECGKLLSRKDKLKDHMITNHSGNAPIRCDVCGKLTPNEYSHRRHMQLHSADRPVFPCPCCEKFYTSTTSRAYHMIQVHSAGQGEILLPRSQQSTEPRSRECHICGKTMMHYKSLKGHLLRHAKNGNQTSNPVLSEDNGSTNSM